MAGCGGAFSSDSTALHVDLTTHALRTGEQLHLAATTLASTEPTLVHWRIAGSDNAPALGTGSISANGVYTPPAMLSRDVVTVSLTAQPANSSPETPPVTTTVSVVPGFVQPLQPENATLSPGSSLQVRAQLAEVGAGSVTWSLKNADDSPADTGTLTNQHCDRGPQQFTTCTVTYTAPASPGAQLPASVSLVATTRAAANLSGVSVRARLMFGPVSSNPALHQQQQSGAISLGASGGSDNDFDSDKDQAGARYVADCCGGTLGALVEDQSGNPYILSNNHVLAVSDQGRPGNTIEQPGLIDNGCVPLAQAGTHLQSVGALRYAVPLNAPSTNVDAALASVHPGAVNPTGAILELGSPLPTGSLGSGLPVAGPGEALDADRLNGLSVVKSGRTTGLTCSTVDAVDLRVTVDYYKDCAETQPYTSKTFTGQIGIGGEAFADSGDSGALVLDAANARAIGLLYATGTSGTAGTSSTGDRSTGFTLANPIGDVLAELAQQTGSPMSLRGATSIRRLACLNYDPPASRPASRTLTPDERARLASAVEAAAALRSARVLAAAPATSADAPGEGAVLLYVDRAQPPVPLPDTIAGVRTILVPSDPAMIARPAAEWPTTPIKPGLHLDAGGLAAARATADRLGPRLMQVPAIFGVGIAQSLDDPGQAALLVLIDSDAATLETAHGLQQLARAGDAAPDRMPAVLGGLRVRYMRMHRLRVTQSKYIARGAASGCALRKLAGARDWRPASLLPAFPPQQ